MKHALRTLAAILTGLALAFILILAVEFFAELFHPAAPFNGNIPEQVRQYPTWVLAAVVLGWGLTAAAATWAAARVGKRPAALVLTVILAAALGYNLTMLPYAPWFKIAMFIAFPLAALLGIQKGTQGR